MESRLEVRQSESHSTGSLTAENRVRKVGRRSNRSIRGVSLIELLVVAAITVIISAIALPQLISQRRLTRSVAVTREILTQLRYARQAAMSQKGATGGPTDPLRRVAYTFQYDDSTKQIKIIGPIPSGTPGLTDGAYPNNTGSRVVTIPLTQGGIDSSEIRYGIPTTSTGLPAGSTALPTGALADGVSKTDLISSKLNITFQPDGSVIDTAGNPVDRAMFIFNNKAAAGTASAISVLGSSGRVKVWRYNLNGNKYAE